MEIDTALLCEAASVREGLFFILGGAITEVVNLEYPAELGLTLALRILVHPAEMEHPHRLEIVLQDEDGKQITKVNGDIQLGGSELVPVGEKGEVLIPWRFPGKPMLPDAGRYSFELLIDGLFQRSIPLRASTFSPPEGIG